MVFTVPLFRVEADPFLIWDMRGEEVGKLIEVLSILLPHPISIGPNGDARLSSN